MKTQLFKAGSAGMLIGLSISILVSLLWAPDYNPLNPYSLVGQWMAAHQVHGALVLSYCLLIWFAIGILFELASYIFRRTDWSLLRMTLSHYLVTCLGFLPLASLAGWFPMTLSYYLMLVMEFSAIYLLVWAISYWKMKRQIEQLNRHLQQQA